MKKFQILNLIIVLLLLCSCSSNDDNDETSSTHLIGEWEAFDECLNDTCWGLGVTYDFLTFNNDGTVIVGRDNPNNNATLSYTIDGSEMTMTQTENGGATYTTYSRIITLTSDELVFEEYADDSGNHVDIEKYYFVKTNI